MKKRSSWIVLLALILCLAGAAGCGPTGGEALDAGAGGKTDGGPEAGAQDGPDGAAADGQDAESAGHELQPVSEYGYEDVEGCWYSQSPEGRIYLMRIYQVSKEAEARAFFLECMEDPEFSYTGDLYLTPYTDDAGTEMTYCNIAISNLQDGNAKDGVPQNVYMGELLADGSFRFSPPRMMNENGEIVQAEGLELMFTHQFPFPSYAVDYGKGSLSGLWYASHEDEDVFLMAREDGHFLLWQEESLASGTWRLDNNTLTLTCEMVDGEPYTDADAVIATSMQENGDIDFGEVPLKAVSGKHVGVYNAAVANNQGGEDPYHLELFADGGFHFYAEYQDTGNSRDVAGICLYQSDTEADLMYLVMNGSTDIRTPASITVNSDGTLLMKHGDAEIIFTEEK